MEISLSYQNNLIEIMYFILSWEYLVTANLTYTLMTSLLLDGRPRSRRICPGVRLRSTPIIRHIVSYIWAGFETSLTNQINFIALIFYHNLGKVNVNLTYTPILASKPRSRRICPGVRLRTTLIIRHIVSYIRIWFEISLTNQINFIVLMCFTKY